MGNLFDALRSTEKGRSVDAGVGKNPSTVDLQASQSNAPPTSTPWFNDKSELQTLAQNLAAQLPSSDQNVIQFIGSQAGEGTSTLTREFAITLAEQSKKPILLVDADSKHPSQNRALGLEAKPPLDYVLKEGKALEGGISQIGAGNLFLASLSSQFLRSLTERSFFHSTDMWSAVRTQFSLILIDSSPVGDSVDSLALCESVNGVVLVVASETTRAAVIQYVKKVILRREGQLLGLVYTKRKFHIPQSIHKFL